MPLLRWTFFATLSLILWLQMRGLNESLTTPDTPLGLVGYEIAWSATRATSIVDAWRSQSLLETAKVRLGLGFAFLLAYPLMLRTGATLLLRLPPANAFDRFGQVIRRAVLLCMPLDVVSNLALWRMLDHGATPSVVHLASISAVVRFVLVIGTTLWCLAAIVRKFIMRRPAQAG